MSTYYQINRVKLSNEKRINTNINEVISYSDGYLKIEKSSNSKDDYFNIKDKNGNYGWIHIDDNNNIEGIDRYGGNNIRGILSVVKSFMRKQIDNKTYNFYKKNQIELEDCLVVDEYTLGNFENEILNKGKKLWNCLNTYDYDTKMEDEVVNSILECGFGDFLFDKVELKELENLKPNELIDLYLNDSDCWIKDTEKYLKSEKYIDEVNSIINDVISSKSKQKESNKLEV